MFSLVPTLFPNTNCPQMRKKEKKKFHIYKSHHYLLTGLEQHNQPRCKGISLEEARAWT